MLEAWQRSRVYPVAAASDLVPRHVFHGMLLGQEMAVWRADDGFVNVWENRCLHRGVRLTIGANLGHELMCQYHGWRYANRTAGCTYIPAHPADAPARTICNRTYPTIEKAGLIWTALDGEGLDTRLPDLPPNRLPLRAIEILAGLDAVEQALPSSGEIHCFLQPADRGVTILRALLPMDSTMATRRKWDHRLCRLRDQLEASGSGDTTPIGHEIRPVSAELATMPERSARKAEIRVQVEEQADETEDIKSLTLQAVEGQLPAFQPGAHLDLHLPNGMIRQYSITNGPDDVTNYRIAVKREAGGKGGSAFIHNHLKTGDLLAISAPRNNFPLRRDQLHLKLIAGGIGLTPLLAMAKTLKRNSLSFEFHLFAQSENHIPFKDDLAALGAQIHTGLNIEQSRQAFEKIIGEQREKESIYVCGPPPMLDAVRTAAKGRGWPDSDVHFEYFQNERLGDTSKPFEVALARSALTVRVEPGESIVEALRSHGIDIPTSCEKGACGTCLVDVVEGEIDHQDVYLSKSERRQGTYMTACVSRARSGRLVLDL